MLLHRGGLMMPDPWLLPPAPGESRQIATASSSLWTIGWLRRRSILVRLRTITPRSNGFTPMQQSAALIARELPWAVRATAQRALPFTRATAMKFPSYSSCSSTPSWTTERAAPGQRRPPLATFSGLRVPIVLAGARCSGASGFVQGAGSCRTLQGNQRRRPAAYLDRCGFYRPVRRRRHGVRAPAHPRRNRNRASGRTWCLPRIRSPRAGRRSLQTI